ncbi:nicotinate-nucleotide adenylyltransferase [Xylophilus sp. GOD-11R]|uniref:nicotinate-nucleotide adenylyltransferase n=1 Tax=Xylophilus sp. GOD-11R TaxID=3089814 RepID=UPI00298CCCF5|nr:nicotinate-nucleotide adenylyltransferase [Xylophilus sp. GOD-11R]WPB55221.1 nicotinate-nucleotide adenylyltransferase [Xylophilus sp. GOD-11R]
MALPVPVAAGFARSRAGRVLSGPTGLDLNHTEKPLRVGIFGGAFDPPHHAHVALAEAASAQLRLDRLLLIPTGSAWHKARPLSPAVDRAAMAHAAFDHIAGAAIDERELRRDGPSYTVDTLRELRSEQPAAQFFLIIGGDQAASLPSWHDWNYLLAQATVAIARRPGASFDASGPLWRNEPGARWCWIDMPTVDTSATDIRDRAARGEDLRPLVPPGVARYIDQHHLYRTA